MYNEIRSADVDRWREDGAGIVDVREPWEYEAGHLPGAVNIPMAQVVARLAEIGDPVVLVCATGNRSGRVAEYLTKNGHSKVANLLGGTVEWAELGNEVVRGATPDDAEPDGSTTVAGPAEAGDVR